MHVTEIFPDINAAVLDIGLYKSIVLQALARCQYNTHTGETTSGQLKLGYVKVCWY